jgi:hypothetical protein
MSEVTKLFSTLTKKAFWRASVTACVAIGAMSAEPVSAQLFSNGEGYSPDGTYRVHVEVTPYLWLPALSASIGLRRPAGTDVSVNRPRETVSQLVNSLNGAFAADSIVRYGPWSAELNIFWVSADQSKTFPRLVNAPEVKLKTSNSTVFVSPGVGYQIIPNFAPETLSFDVRAGFSYFETSAAAKLDLSSEGEAQVSYDFVQPWLGVRADYYPSPNWRIDLASAVTGLSVDSVWGWNARLGISYLIARWVDASLGFAALGTDRSLHRREDGSSRSVRLVAYGPVAGFGFRF